MDAVRKVGKLYVPPATAKSGSDGPVKAESSREHDRCGADGVDPVGADRNHDRPVSVGSQFASTKDVDPETQAINFTFQPDSPKRDWGWTSERRTLKSFSEIFLSEHEERKAKDGKCFVPGVLIGDRRNKKSVKQLDTLLFDLDRSSEAEIQSTLDDLEAAGLYYYAHTTFSHESCESEVKYDDYQTFCRDNELDPKSDEAARKFLVEKKRYPLVAIKTARVSTMARDTSEGVTTVLAHGPIHKVRLVLVLDRPYIITDMLERGFTEEDARERLWNTTLDTFAKRFGLSYDTSCKDVSRAYYAASCRPGAKAFSWEQPGKEVRLDAILPKTPEDLDRISPKKSKTSTIKEKTTTEPKAKVTNDGDQFVKGLNLKAWVAQYAKTFLVEELFKARGVVLKGFVLHCSGGTNDCADLDRLEKLKRYVEAGLITVEDLQNPEYGGGVLSARILHEHLTAGARQSLQVVDKKGQGIDAAIFHASMIARPGLFDFTRLNQTCGTQISSDVTAEQLAGFIEAGMVAVADLTQCGTHKAQCEDDPYSVKLNELARLRAKGSILGRDFENRLSAIANEFKVKTKTIESDFRKIEAGLTEVVMPGMLSPEETALIPHMRDYVREFGIVNTGGKAMIMNLREPDLSKALMASPDFELLYKKDWLDIRAPDGSVKTIYPAKEFVAKPPKDARVYHGGFVFKPSGTVSADQFNLYKGMLINPDPSGSYDLLKALLREVWTANDEQYQWVWEWLLHIIAFPGTKVSTSIAIRGEQGDGKSIVTEKLISRILGDMLLRVANPKLILGDFNESAIAKLLIVLEEATFAGDKATFDKLKEQVTGDKMVINPKFKAPIVVDNYARMMIVSNHDHFMHIKPGDRRYTILETSSAWSGDRKKFVGLMEQWENGGAASFVYDAVNHSFRKFDDHQTLVIDTNLKTESSVRQIALSRSPLEKCIVATLLSGRFDYTESSTVVDYAHLLPEDPGPWKLDCELKFQSRKLLDVVTKWLQDSKERAGHYEITVHSIINMFVKYVGNIGKVRPKGKSDGADDKRHQLPTIRILPERRIALEHAHGKRLITEEEFDDAMGGGGRQGNEF